MDFEREELYGLPPILGYERAIGLIVKRHRTLSELIPDHGLLGLIKVQGDSCFAPENEYYEKYEKPVLERNIPGERVLVRQIRVMRGYRRDLDEAIAREIDRRNRTKELESSQKA